VALYTNFQVLDSKDSYCGVWVMTPVNLADGYKYCNNTFLEKEAVYFITLVPTYQIKPCYNPYDHNTKICSMFHYIRRSTGLITKKMEYFFMQNKR